MSNKEDWNEYEDDDKLIEGFRNVVIPFLALKLGEISKKNGREFDVEQFEQDNMRVLCLAKNGIALEPLLEAKEHLHPRSCINTINQLRKLALNIHGVIDAIDDANCNELIDFLTAMADVTEAYQEGK
jgi:hypothetical protein